MNQSSGSQKRPDSLSSQPFCQLEEDCPSNPEMVLERTAKFLEPEAANSQNQPETARSEKMTPLTEYQFFTVWTEAAGRPGYDKSLFREVFENLKSRNLVIPSRLSPMDFSRNCEVREIEKLPAVSGLVCFSKALLGRD